ncbi:hypothetical protein [Pseudoalteromonas sp. PS5]|uniref:hypothetical protein n=1 Tax=Pseudoalteromonas sp. PS5 TaxID=1437473 RepID=UPI000FFF5E96|nr:hypothetical protein [Pseudoalteromonas sp. PS5]
MSMECVFDPPVFTEAVRLQFQKLDSYDDPCLVFITTNHTVQWCHNTLHNILQAEGISHSDILAVSENTHFFLCYCDPTTIQVFVDEVVAVAVSADITTFLSVFRHNCLSNPKETFRWCTQQLQGLIENSSDNVGAALNDFRDKANWPGIADYQQPEQQTSSVDNAEKKTRDGFFASVAKFFGFGCQDERQLGFEITPTLSIVKIFIESLPSGSALWAYVKTGKGKEQLVRSHALLDLDHVLLLPHACRYAPEFYNYIMSTLRHSTIVEQNEIQQYFYRAISELTEELLESESKKEAKQACFLRILDIFYHLFDQQSWSDDFYELLVEDEDTACLSAEAYQARFIQEIEISTDGVSEKLKQQILELLDKLEDYHFASYRQWCEITKLFKSNRQAVNPENWLGTEPSSRLLLACILLYQDKLSAINDESTQALRQLINESLIKQVLKKIEEDIAHDCKLPESFVAWLTSEKQGIDTECIDRLAKNLAPDTGLDAHKTEHTAQPHTQLFSSISDFQAVLASCYWLELSEPNIITRKVIAMALKIAPQASLSCFIGLQLKRFGSFGEPEQKKQILANLQQVNVDAYDLLTFEVRLAQGYDIQWYEKLVKQYVKMKKSDRERWDKALAKVTPATRDYFYLDVYRLAPKVTTPLIYQRENMIEALISSTLYFDDDFIATYFNQKELLFSDHIEFLPEKFELPVSLHQQVLTIKNDVNFVIFLYDVESLILVAKTDGVTFCSGSNSISWASHYIILDNQVDLDKLTVLAEQFESYQARAKTLQKAVTDYLSGVIIFSEFQRYFGHYSDTKKYDLHIENYSKYSTRILPQILVEPDEQVQLRLIKLLCSHKTRGNRVLKKVAEQLFFDHYLTNGNADFEMRHDPELNVDELTDDWIETWQAFYTTLAEKVSSLR